MSRDTLRFSERHEFEKPNDAEALNLMDLSAKVGQRVPAILILCPLNAS